MNLPSFRKSYGSRTVLDFPGADLSEGRVCAVIGTNGSGKSTLARLAAGVLEPDPGCSGWPDRPQVGYLPQHSYPFQMSVRANVLLNAAGLDRKQARNRADALLDRLGILPLADKPAHRLSGGETARMALARLLMRDYGLLVLDEPTAAMDIRSTVLAEELVSDYRVRTGCTVLWITHSLKQARRTADTVLFLQEGQLAEQGPAETLLTAPRTQALRRFLEFYAL